MKDKKLIRVVMLDDHQIIRDGIRAQLKASGRIQVVGEGGAGENLEKLVCVHKPDVVLLDIEMPQHAGEKVREGAKPFLALPAIRRMQELFPEVRFLVISQHLDRTIVEALMNSGASGYLLKDDAMLTDKLVMAIDTVYSGGVFISKDVISVMMRAEATAVPETLSERHKEVLSEMILHANASMTDIADYLGIADSTMRNHTREIRERLRVRTNQAAIIKGIQMGLVAIDAVSFGEEECEA